MEQNRTSLYEMFQLKLATAEEERREKEKKNVINMIKIRRVSCGPEQVASIKEKKVKVDRKKEREKRSFSPLH